MSGSESSEPAAAGRIFHFEADFAGDLRCIPMVVRCKLDRIGLKLGLPHWHRLSAEERHLLVKWPQDASGLERMRQWLLERTAAMPEGEARPMAAACDEAWQQGLTWPEALLEACRALDLALPEQGWGGLDELERFALVKLSRPGHEHRNLSSALREFGLIA